MKNGFAHIILIAVIAATLIVFGLVYIKSLQKTPYTNPSPAQTSTTTATQSAVKKSSETIHVDAGSANWKTYENKEIGITFKYPDSMSIKKETNNKIELTSKYGTYLNIITNNIKTFDTYSNCSSLAGKNWVPCVNESLSDTTLGQKPAKSFYIICGVTDCYERSVQTVSNPKIELIMDQAGGGLSNTFDQILSTFKFLK